MMLEAQVLSWKQEQPCGHCMRQSHPKKSQHMQREKQWESYWQRNCSGWTLVSLATAVVLP